MSRSHKRTVLDMRALDVRRLSKEGLLTPGRTSWWWWGKSPFAQLRIDADEERIAITSLQPMGDKSLLPWIINVSRTPCHLGGERLWFLCPTFLCGRRVAILYGGDVFRCRHCHHLAYDSSRENPGYRALRRAQTLRKRLGGTADMSEPFPAKPKWMRWRTYDRISDRALVATRAYYRSLSDMLYGPNEKPRNRTAG